VIDCTVDVNDKIYLSKRDSVYSQMRATYCTLRPLDFPLTNNCNENALARAGCIADCRRGFSTSPASDWSCHKVFYLCTL